jgi:hypothetical protein
VHLHVFWLFSTVFVSVPEHEDKKITRRIPGTTHDQVGVMFAFVVDEIRGFRYPQIATDPSAIELRDLMSHIDFIAIIALVNAMSGMFMPFMDTTGIPGHPFLTC